MAYRGVGELDKADAHLRQRGHVRSGIARSEVMLELNQTLHSAITYERLGVDATHQREWAAAAAYFRKEDRAGAGQPVPCGTGWESRCT